jgi:hypothetical protein
MDFMLELEACQLLEAYQFASANCQKAFSVLKEETRKTVDDQSDLRFIQHIEAGGANAKQRSDPSTNRLIQVKK